ncbi:MAG: DUF1134 domain-containing protein [Hyphomicrobiaceae bacterium]
MTAQPARLALIACLAAGVLLCAPRTASAEPCSRDSFAKIVNESGAALRRLSADTQPKMQAGFRRLKDKNGWREDDYIDKATAVVTDERSEALDQKATELLARLDRLAEDAPNSPDSCAKLAELQATALELQATVRAKTDYVMARLDSATVEAPPAKAQPKALPGTPPVGKKAPGETTVANRQPEKPAEKEKLAEKKPEAGTTKGWTSSTSQQNPQSAENTLPIQPLPGKEYTPLPQGAVPAEDGYTIDEIRAATRGFFGNVSTGLASVIEYSFSKSGRPSAYVLGNEGGGALIAGVRYGKGTLYLRDGGTREVYWHGPSIGYDLGAAGSKTMFLIYRMTDPESLFGGFTGVDGSAYVVGGVGLTFLTDGKIVMAPIRSGLGLRIGASIGYVRFTPRPTWNPF